MKKMIKYLMILCGAAFVGAACTDSTEYDNVDVRPIKGLLYPTNGSAIELFKESSAKTNFEWEKSAGTQQYMVVFYGSDKKTELGSYQADNNGVNNSLQMAHSELSAIAMRAGIEAGRAGDIYWNVINKTASASAIGATPSKLTVTRYTGALEIPYNLYLTGAGSEFGTDPATAKALRRMGAGKYEIYTKFTGEFSFINRNEEGNKRIFGVADDGIMTEGSEAVGTADGVYRVSVDFNTGKVKMEKIESVKYHWCNTPDPAAVLEYAGNGTWKRNITCPTGDDRYRFTVMIDGKEYIWGYSGKNMDPKPTGLTGDAYKISMRERGTIDQWDFAYKFIDALKGVACTLVVDCSPEVAAFYHRFEFAFEPEASPVTLVAPANNNAVSLNAQVGSKVTFSWNKLSDADPAGKLTTYTLIFYSDAEHTKAVSRKDALYAGSIDMSHVDLENVASSAGVAAEGTGDIYWAIESKLLSWTALSDVRKLTVTRMQGIPTVAYITGAGSEFNTGYGKMHIITDEGADKGKFEIYVKMTKNGKFDLTTAMDPSSASYRKYEIKLLTNGGSIVENSNADNNFTLESGVYRLIVDFKTNKISSITSIGKIYFVSAHQRDKTDCELTYTSNGVWTINNVAPDFHSTDWGGEDRCYFWMYLNGVKSKLGGNQSNSSENKNPQPPTEGDSSWFVYLNGDTSDWDWHLRLWNPYRGQNPPKRMNVKLNMNCGTFSHPYGYIDYLEK